MLSSILVAALTAAATIPAILAFPYETATATNFRRDEEPTDMSNCPDIDHHFQHQKFWVAASSLSKCMALEKDLDIIHELNRLSSPSPDGFEEGYSLVCSLEKQRCDWSYSPLDPVPENLQISGNETERIQYGGEQMERL